MINATVSPATKQGKHWMAYAAKVAGIQIKWKVQHGRQLNGFRSKAECK